LSSFMSPNRHFVHGFELSANIFLLFFPVPAHNTNVLQPHTKVHVSPPVRKR